MHQLVFTALGVLILSACGSSPTTFADSAAASVPKTPEHVTLETDATIDPDAELNDTGLGTLAENGRDLRNCGHTRRLGSRIPRDVCDPTSFNGLYPSGGLNMGTPKESQIGYGSH